MSILDLIYILVHLFCIWFQTYSSGHIIPPSGLIKNVIMWLDQKIKFAYKNTYKQNISLILNRRHFRCFIIQTFARCLWPLNRQVYSLCHICRDRESFGFRFIRKTARIRWLVHGHFRKARGSEDLFLPEIQLNLCNDWLFDCLFSVLRHIGNITAIERREFVKWHVLDIFDYLNI